MWGKHLQAGWSLVQGFKCGYRYVRPSLIVLSVFLSFFHVCFSPSLCQRWVTEKLSVESLRDLELFGGEVSMQARLQSTATLSCIITTKLHIGITHIYLRVYH